MSGELVARLRDQATAYECFDGMRNDAAPLREAADRIEELEGNDAEGKFAAAVVSLHRAEKRIERMEAVVAAARGRGTGSDASVTQELMGLAGYLDQKGMSAWGDHLHKKALALEDALAALDAPLGTSPDTQSSAPNLVQRPIRADNDRPCPNGVSWCGGPDRYGDTCAGCLATWTEEAKEKAK